MNAETIIRNKQGTIVDVRTNEEFQSGHAAGAVNIPLQQIGNRLSELDNLPKPLVLCCASGGRSGQAEYFLTQKGIDCCNAGSWFDVHQIQNSQTV